jgi:hypothetical protein
MPHFRHTIEIERSPLDVWRAIGTPERWFEGYLETRSRSEGYPGPDTRDDHLYHTRRNEEVGARVTRSEAPNVLEEDQEGKTFTAQARALHPDAVAQGDVGAGGGRRDVQGRRQAGRAACLAGHQEALGDIARQAEGRSGERTVVAAGRIAVSRSASYTRPAWRPRPQAAMPASIQRRTRSTSSSDQGASQGIVPSASREWISSAFSQTSS